jgi:hypothetical protein
VLHTGTRKRSEERNKSEMPSPACTKFKVYNSSLRHALLNCILRLDGEKNDSVLAFRISALSSGAVRSAMLTKPMQNVTYEVPRHVLSYSAVSLHASSEATPP